MTEAYVGKKFSVLSDSIGTLDGYSRPSDAAFYAGDVKFKADVFLPEDTWWGQIIERLGGELLVNNSISGCTVTCPRGCDAVACGISEERADDLSRDGRSPDVVLIYMGTNDWGWGFAPTPEDAEEDGLSVFSTAYRRMLYNVRTRYPAAEIWCFTLAVTACSARESYVFPYCYGRRHIERYCDVIRDVAVSEGCRVVDLYCSGVRPDSIEGFHPNAKGMRAIAEVALCDL